MSQTLILVLFILFVAIIQGIFFFKQYIKVPPDKILVVYGKVSQDSNESYLVHTAGSHFVWPVIQEYKFVDVVPQTLKIEVQAQDKQQESLLCHLLLDYQISKDAEVAKKYIALTGANPVKSYDENIRKKLTDVLRTHIRELLKRELSADVLSLENALKPKVKQGIQTLGLELIDIRDLYVR